MGRTLPTLLSALLAWVHGFAAPVDILPAGFDGASQPQVSLDAQGGVHVAFGKGNSVYYAHSKEGARWSAPTLVGTLHKLALGLRRGPRITASPGKVLVTAISHEDGNLHAWGSTDGKTWTEQTTLNAVPNSAREGLHALASDGAGNVAVTWLDLRLGKMSLWAKFSSDGGQRWTDDRLVYAAPDGPICQCCAPAVAFAADGRVGFLWRNLLQGARDLYLSETIDGKTFTQARKLGQGTWLLNACPMDGGSLAYGPDGKSHPVWKRERTVFASDDLATEAKLAQPAAQAVAAYAGGIPLTLWEANGSLMMQRGDAAPQTYARGGKFAAIHGRGPMAAIAFEGIAPDGHRTLLTDIIK